ncbi:hypothetical protein GN956_G17416 [Arapaima gigas]
MENRLLWEGLAVPDLGRFKTSKCEIHMKGLMFKEGLNVAGKSAARRRTAAWCSIFVPPPCRVAREPVDTAT